MTFHCPNCGPTDDGLGDGHGDCVACGRPLVRLQLQQPQRQLTGIEKEFANVDDVDDPNDPNDPKHSA